MNLILFLPRKLTAQLRGCAVIVLMLVQFLSATAVHAQVRHNILAATGEAAPAGGNYLTFPSNRVFNVRGQVAFDALLSGPSGSGVFISHDKTTSTIALGGDPNPAAGNFDFVSGPSLTTNGDVIFNTSNGIFRNDGKRIVSIVQNGDPAPGGGSLTLALGVANSRGVILYQAFIDGGANTQGVFRNDGSQTVPIVLDSNVAPTGGTFLFFSSPVMDDDGNVSFFAATSGGSSDFGIYRGDGQNLSTIFAANQAAPGGGTFVDFSDPIINNKGQVLAQAMLANASGPTGLFLSDGIDSVAIARAGEPAPKGGNYSSFFGLQVLNDRGQIAFSSLLSGGNSRSGVFRRDGDTITPIALERTAAPGTTGTFASFADIKMGKDGVVAFIGRLTPGVGGVNTSNNVGIWIGTSETDLRLVARTGEVISGRTLTAALSLGQVETNEKTIVWLGRFSGNTTAIISSELTGNTSSDQ
jgi:hypothetical protein